MWHRKQITSRLGRMRRVWDNFARLTVLLAKVRVWFNNLTIYLDFSALFSEIAPSKLITKGRQVRGHFFAARPPRGAILARTPMLRHCLPFSSLKEKPQLRAARGSGITATTKILKYKDFNLSHWRVI